MTLALSCIKRGCSLFAISFQFIELLKVYWSISVCCICGHSFFSQWLLWSNRIEGWGWAQTEPSVLHGFTSLTNLLCPTDERSKPVVDLKRLHTSDKWNGIHPRVELDFAIITCKEGARERGVENSIKMLATTDAKAISSCLRSG